MKSVTKLLVLVLLSFICGIAPQKGEAGHLHHIETDFQHITEDSLNLYAKVYGSRSVGRVPLVITLHMYSKSHMDYTQMMRMIDEISCWGSWSEIPDCMHILSFDLRGHGNSTIKGTDTISYKDRSENEFKRIPTDIANAVRAFLDNSNLKIDTNRIFVVGASVGANAAIMLTEHLPNISRVVMISPGENYLGLEPTEAIRKYKKEILIVVGTEDEYSYESSKKFARLDAAKIQLKDFETKEHGTNLINDDSLFILPLGQGEPLEYLVRWLLEKDK